MPDYFNYKKLTRRIERDIKRCTYIGDISIDDNEYIMLKNILQTGYRKICDSANHEIINPLFAVALVQVGIRYYDGRFWPYVQRELNLEKPLPGYQQSWIGTSFYKTLVKYNKFHVDESEFMNNILLHCFITNHYANDLFDFLFAYYQIDLDRDLSQNNKEMRNNLMQTMSKGEMTKRAYKIKKHTADAVSANERGCKTRVAHILRFMDNALFNDSFPTNSRNRIAQLFCKWAKSSMKFDFEKKRTRGLTHSGEKRFSTPYIHFDIKKEGFCLVLPPQYIHLDDNEELPDITWKIRIGENEQIFPANTDNCVTGCKTEKFEYSFQSELLMSEINIELWRNDILRIQRFKIKSDTVRFFDSDWDMIDSATYAKYLPAGNAFAFCYPNEILLSDSDAVVDCEKNLGYDLYTLDLKKGDVLRLPNGKAKSVGKPLEEGILSQNLVSGANAFEDGEKYPIYNAVPSVYFRMTPVQENGTLIVINGAKYRFDIEKCVRFDMDEETEEKGYIVKLNDLITAGGIYNVMIDVPNSRKERNYLFAFLPAFSYQFENAPYIFQKNGMLTFPEGSMIRCSDPLKHITRFCFDISPDQDELPFVYDAEDRTIDIHIFIPVLKWKFDENEWEIAQPKEIWHKEFPKFIYITYPDDEISFSMFPTMLEASEDTDENDSFTETFNKSKDQHLFECDTRKIISWFGYEDVKRTLYLTINGVKIQFADVLLKNHIDSCNIVRDGFNRVDRICITVCSRESTYIDIYQDGKLVLEKALIEYTKEYSVPSSAGTRKYSVCLYVKEDDDFGSGGETFELCDRKEYLYNNLGDLSKNMIRILSSYPVEMKNQAITFSGEYCIKNISQRSINEYEGTLFSRKVNYRLNEIAKVSIHFLSKTCVKLSALDSLFTFYYGYITKSLYVMSAQEMIRSANPREYTNLNDFVFEIAIENEIKLASISSEQNGVKKKYNYPIDKTSLKPSTKQKLENAKFFSTDQIVDYGLDRLCTIQRIKKSDALEIIDMLEQIGYRFSAIDQIRNHYREDEI